MAFFCLVGVASGDASSNGDTPPTARRLPLNHQRPLRGVGRTTGDGLAGKRSPEGESAGGAERAEGRDARSERPATWCGQSRASQGQAQLETGPSPDANVRRRGAVNPEPGKGRAPTTTDQAAGRVTETTAAASCSPSPDRGDRTETSCPDPRAPPHGSETRTAP